MNQKRRLSQAIITVLQDAITWILLFGLTGAGLLIAGVMMLHGVAWALVVAAGCCFLFAFLIMRGVTRGE